MSGISQRLTDASLLYSMLKLRSPECVAVTVFANETRFQLKLEPLAQVARKLNVPLQQIHFSEGTDGTVHLAFQARNTTFCSCVRIDELDRWKSLTRESRRVTQEQAAIEHDQPQRLIEFSQEKVTQ